MFWGLAAIGGLILLNQRRSEMKQSELVARITAAAAAISSIGTEVTKIGTEVTGLNEAIATLKAELDDVDLSPEAEAAMAALEEGISNVANSVTAVDQLVPDATLPPVEPTDPENPDASSGVQESGSSSS